MKASCLASLKGGHNITRVPPLWLRSGGSCPSCVVFSALLETTGSMRGCIVGGCFALTLTNSQAASSTGGLCNRACTSDEINVFINAVLKATDPASSHSLKHTTLEWCSAYGIDEGARKLLGHHSLSGDKALAVYSRDLLRRPLQLYCSMLRNIRLDHFRPDESRTSRLTDALKIQAGVAVAPTQKVTQQGADSVEAPTATEEAHESENGEESNNDDSSSSSSSSSSLESSSDEAGDDSIHDVERHDWITGPGLA